MAGEEGVTTNFGGVDVVALLGAIGVYFGGVDVVPLLGAIAGCHCSVLWWREGRVTTNFGGVDVVIGRGRETNFGGGGGAIAGSVVASLGAIAGCHCSVLWLRGRVTTNFGGVDVVRLLGATAGPQSLFHIFLLYTGPPLAPRHPRKQQWILSWASCRRYTVFYIDNTKLGFCYPGSMLV